MEIKAHFYKALIMNDGRLNGIDLGEEMQLEENEIREVISQLLSEHKIEYVKHKSCNYRVIKR